jgi:hypothetical protein
VVVGLKRLSAVVYMEGVILELGDKREIIW